METRSKGQIEAEIAESITKFEKSRVGKGPEEVKCYIIKDLVIIRMKGVLTLTEQNLAIDPEGVTLVKQCRACLFARSKTSLHRIIKQALNAEVENIFTDLNTSNREMFIIFCLDQNVEDLLFKTSMVI
ncbi:DUF2294 domain-containing protein [bacterium]|nr:DUF2294 domain-containing protein [bacterium]